MPRRLFLPLLLVILAGCRLEAEHAVILVSIDGFRADYVDRLRPPNLTRLAGEGAWAAEGMLPVFPTKTFPNHYSIATGLYPARHGIVANTMYDAEREAWFRIGDRSAVEDPAWWGGEPIWVTAEKQGVVAGNFYWVGSEAPVQGIQSTHWKRFDASVTGEARVDSVLFWLDLPDGRRPRFITLYFADPDSEGHRGGPDSAELAEAVARVDSWIGRLLAGLESRNLEDRVDVIVVSDHGMTDVSRDRVVVVEDYVDLSLGTVIEYSPVLAWDADPTDRPAIEAGIDGMPHVTRYGPAELDSLFRYGGNDRIPPIIAVADDGWTLISTHERLARRGDWIRGGMHGYDPRLPSMRALFVARGPSFVPGSRVEPFACVDVYPLVARILGLVPAPNDGSLDVIGSALRPELRSP